MAHGKERKNATLAQELLSEDTLQQLLKQEELWQLQNRRINFKNLHFWTHLVVVASSWRSSHPSNLMRISVLSCPWLQEGLDWVLLRSCTPSGCPAICRANCRMTSGLWDAKMILRFYNLPQLFTAWKPARLHHPIFAAERQNQTQVEVSSENTNCYRLLRIFKGIKLKSLGVCIT